MDEMVTKPETLEVATEVIPEVIAKVKPASKGKSFGFVLLGAALAGAGCLIPIAWKKRKAKKLAKKAAIAKKEDLGDDFEDEDVTDVGI